MEPEIGQPIVPKPQGVASTHSLLRLALVLFVIVVLAVVLTGGYAGLAKLFGISSTNTTSSTNKQQFVQAPEGLLIMTAAVKSASSTKTHIFPATYDFLQKKLVYVPVDKLAASPNGMNLAIQYAFSGNANFITFVGAVDVGNASSISDIPMQVYKADISGATTYKDFIAKLQQAERVTSGGGIFRQNPSISNQGDIIYTAHKPEDSQVLFSSAANEWDIHYVSKDGKDSILTKGIYPKWVGDDRFVFLKNGGLYMYSMADKQEKKIWGGEGVATMAMNLDVSNDYQYVAWTAPDVRGVYILQDLNWGAGDSTLKGVIPIAATSAVFSPDSLLVAIQAIAAGKGAGEDAVTENFYDVNTLVQVTPPLVLRGMDQKLTYLSDWIQ